MKLIQNNLRANPESREYLVAKLLMFSIVGAAGFLADYGVVTIIVLGMDGSPYLARFFSFLGAVTVTCILNKRFTFSDKKAKYEGIKGVVVYGGLMVVGLCCNYLTYSLLLFFVLSKFPLSPLSLLFAVACGSASGMVVNFLLCHLWFFRGK
ncbi:GtrA family protein [Desulfosarcina sp. OttesenSCG-928-B08]|nr:GtrA family protein [Desulfosarcina sp. OttesenSCG-928-B08]